MKLMLSLILVSINQQSFALVDDVAYQYEVQRQLEYLEKYGKRNPAGKDKKFHQEFKWERTKTPEQYYKEQASKQQLVRLAYINGFNKI